jgi:ribosomal protein L4
MAQKTIVQLIDDLDGDEAAETISFGLDGAQYEIDLSENNAAALRDVLATYIAHARRTGRNSARAANNNGATNAPSRRGRSGARTDREQTAQIREWARSNGHKIGDKGRIPADILAAWQDAH